MTVIHRCPKCEACFDPPREEVSECPHCGIWFHKFGVGRSSAAPKVGAAATSGVPSAPMAGDLLATPDPISVFGRLIGLMLVAVWGWHLAALDFRDGEISTSFMHSILLPIHEAGHVFMMPFGEFMTILGGSLFQVALPLAIGLAFVLRQRDFFGATICIWWAGASLIDLAPYIWDSLHPQLILLGGRTGEDGPHDWIYLLQHFGVLHRAHAFGVAVHRLGVLVMMGGVICGAGVLFRQWRRMNP